MKARGFSEAAINRYFQNVGLDEQINKARSDMFEKAYAQALNSENPQLAMAYLAHLAEINPTLGTAYSKLIPTYKDQWDFQNKWNENAFNQKVGWDKTMANIKNQREMADNKNKITLYLGELSNEAKYNAPVFQKQATIAMIQDLAKKMNLDANTTNSWIISALDGGNVSRQMSGGGSGRNSDKMMPNSNYAKPGFYVDEPILDENGNYTYDENNKLNRRVFLSQNVTKQAREAQVAINEAKNMVDAFSKPANLNPEYCDKMNDAIDAARKAVLKINPNEIPSDMLDDAWTTLEEIDAQATGIRGDKF